MEIMLDLETLGTTPGSVILSIGAAAFDIHKGYQSYNFHQHLLLTPQMELGAQMNAGTVIWWLQQSEEARYAQTNAKRVDPRGVLQAFDLWLKGTRLEGEGIWAHGLNFDLPILEALYHRYKLPLPWGYRDGRDTRTLFAMAGKKMGDFETPNPMAHDALQDAIYQAQETAKCANYLRGVRVEASRPKGPTPATNGDI